MKKLQNGRGRIRRVELKMCAPFVRQRYNSAQKIIKQRETKSAVEPHYITLY